MTEENLALLNWLERHKSEAPPHIRQSIQENLRRNAVYLSAEERKRLESLLHSDRKPA